MPPTAGFGRWAKAEATSSASQRMDAQNAGSGVHARPGRLLTPRARGGASGSPQNRRLQSIRSRCRSLKCFAKMGVLTVISVLLGEQAQRAGLFFGRRPVSSSSSWRRAARPAGGRALLLRPGGVRCELPAAGLFFFVLAGGVWRELPAAGLFFFVMAPCDTSGRRPVSSSSSWRRAASAPCGVRHGLPAAGLFFFVLAARGASCRRPVSSS